MNKKIIAGVLAASVLTSFVAPVASAATLSVVPAAYADGFITAINITAHTITVGGQTYALGAGVTLRGDVTTGSEVNLAYVMRNGQATVIAVTPVNELVE